ncbi:hypothetical protein [Runella zeae]|uniref:hypothetical protein n=1 Tax=Runella zeae TaxID=94255 RepID=UPI0003FA343F|nr:hypothetical protein [Runella zeae]
MRDIIRFEEPNPAGGMLVEFAPVNSIKVWSVQTAGRYQSPLEFFEGWRWFKIYSTPEMIQASENQKKDAAGRYFNTAVKCFVPGDSKEYRDVWEWADERKFIVRVREHQGDWKLYGKPWEGLSLMVDYDSDRMMAGQRGFTVSFEGETTSMGGVYDF